MKEIGGYFELECGQHRPRHQGVYVNSGRNALRLIVRKLKISRIHAPYYTCPVIFQALAAEGCEVDPYELDDAMMPNKAMPKGDFVLANDYFGVTGKNIAQLASEYPNLIVDNAQSYYANPLGRACFYSPRKFFGLPDGGIAVFNRDEVDASDLERDVSYERMAHLLKRHDLGAAAGYADFKEVSKQLSDLPIRAMSSLTRALMGNVDEEAARTRRLANFACLANCLRTTFPLFPLPESSPLAFPYITHDTTLRQRLIDNKVYVPTYWPGCRSAEVLVNAILPIPIDHRCGEIDISRILEIIGA